MYNALMSIERILTRIVEALLAVVFMAIFIMVFYQVVLRYGFSTSILGTAEVFTVLFAYASALGAAVMVRHREHIRITVFVDMLPIRVRRWIYAVDYVLIALFSVVIVRESVPWLRSISAFRSPVTGLSRATQSAGVLVGFTLIVFYCVVNALALFLNPEETREELEGGDVEARNALREAQELESRLQTRNADRGGDA